ncbi:hemolysin D [Anaplasma marginale str. Dawn]|uniref:Membrane fusion protein (MFP) family protein n=2 Tax=Anaplasma marginale TaxID=770 RepID=B9KHU4_ANAMF|nr:HlyD family type I secretion periplasmic adaptor subunit [Anaplasma marginale]AAV86348.1 alkaline protease secretion protein [Anaplasma marginale str. St. Maries]ACM49056.1 alkaline protease secretion protein (aprE) [Anaplasma marginale str. Florida]AGZ78624.1 hemolysin D [Anaplasma marginale str. Gypsy Plains]AGZ79477.1 hemolysin D [Anaplasma marginale str. Dawn]AXW83823.1 HlyD family type I secretion periplasmic adaptor subunit [Anaplasma marginale]
MPGIMYGKIAKAMSMAKLDFSLPRLLGHNSLHKERESGTEGSKFVEKSLSIVDRVISFVFRIEKQGENEALKASWGPLLVGLVVVIAFFGFFGIWAATAPLDGAVIAPGEVVSSLNRQVVQHLEGGIIHQILVQDGDAVSKGQPLVLLNDTAAKANLGIIKEKMLVLLATEARLLAIKNRSGSIDFPAGIHDLSSADVVDKVLGNQRELFYSQRKSVSGQLSILEQRIKQLHQELSGLAAQLESEEKQYKLISEELEAKKSLLEEGYISKPYILNLERTQADAEGKLGHIRAKIASAEQKIGENQLEMIHITNTLLDRTNSELKETNASVTDLRERLMAAEDVLKRTVIRSPQNGIVTGLRYHTEGGVIPPGGAILEVVPADDDLIIDAKIPTRNIEEVLSARAVEENLVTSGEHSGLRAKVRLSAYNIRKFGLIDGIVTQVSADALTDSSGVKYYSLRVVIPKSAHSGKFKNLKLYHGMPAEVFVVTRSRTLLNYLLTPITSTFEKAFKER